MKTISKITRKITGITTAAALSFAVLPAVHADTLSFTNASASSVAAAMDKRFGVTIVFRGSVNTSQPVTFSVENPDTEGGRLQAVSNLASALHLDYQKVYVVSKVDPGASVPSVPLDTNGPIVFTSTHIPVREAIQTVASVDDALTRINSQIIGDVTLPNTHMSATEAAAVIARQTGTQWKAYYGLYKRSETPAGFAGTVIGKTNNGQPIKVLPLLSYRSAASVTVPLHDGDGYNAGTLPLPGMTPNVVTVANTNFGIVPDDGLGGYGYGYGDPYGYTNPYGPYGFVPTYGTVAVPTPVVNSTGVGVTTVAPGVTAPAAPSTTTTILPTFPYMGNVGGQTTVGGY